MLTLVRANDTMTSIAGRLGMLRTGEPRRRPSDLQREFDGLADAEKEALEAEFCQRLMRGTTHDMRFYPVLAALYLGEAVAA